MHGFARLKTFLMLIASMALLSGCDKAAGVAAVKEQCAKDGGETIYETTFVNGYLEFYHWADCFACRGALPKGTFEYIDVFVEKLYGREEIVGPGYYRYSMSSVGDRRCDVWEKDRQFQQVKAALGFRPDQCMAVEPITAAISNYSWNRTIKAVTTRGGIQIGLDEFTVFQIEPYRLLGKAPGLHVHIETDPIRRIHCRGWFESGYTL